MAHDEKPLRQHKEVGEELSPSPHLPFFFEVVDFLAALCAYVEHGHGCDQALPASMTVVPRDDAVGDTVDSGFVAPQLEAVICTKVHHGTHPIRPSSRERPRSTGEA